MDKEKLKLFIANEITLSNKSNCSGEPLERGYRAGLKAIQREIEAGYFDKEVTPCQNAGNAVITSQEQDATKEI